MKKYNPIYYLLFILLVMGAFASMAQNSYGIKIMGGVAFAFGLVFLIQLISLIIKKDKIVGYTFIEAACLFLLSSIFGLRVFYIYFPFIELLFVAAAVLLGFVCVVKMINRFRHLQSKNSFLAIMVVIFHLSIILFLASLALVPYVPKVAEFISAISFVLLLGFIVAGFFKKDMLVEGEKVSAFRVVRLFKDHSVIIVSFLLLLSLYVGLNRIGVVPGIYTDEYPRAYYELVNQATSKMEKSVNGKYKYEDFLEKYNQFLKHNKTRNQ